MILSLIYVLPGYKYKTSAMLHVSLWGGACLNAEMKLRSAAYDFVSCNSYIWKPVNGEVNIGYTIM